MPDPAPNAGIEPPSSNKKTTGAIIALAVLVAAPLAATWEGYRGKAYYDPAHILTVCYGETEHIDPAKIYSKDECVAKLRTRMANDYAPRIAKCLPEVVNERRVKVFAALLDASYNAGWGRCAVRAWPLRSTPGTGPQHVTAFTVGMRPLATAKR
jgi:GH24 family phage-related lysozyme (muramidase)